MHIVYTNYSLAFYIHIYLSYIFIYTLSIDVAIYPYSTVKYTLYIHLRWRTDTKFLYPYRGQKPSAYSPAFALSQDETRVRKRGCALCPYRGLIPSIFFLKASAADIQAAGKDIKLQAPPQGGNLHFSEFEWACEKFCQNTGWGDTGFNIVSSPAQF